MMSSQNSFAQKQPGIPRPRGPVDLSETANLIMFIILPALVIVGYFFWRSAYKKRKKRE
nr:adenylosuccinate synthetase [Cytophagales bacterium]